MNSNKIKVFSDEERAAMKERASELRSKVDGESAVMAAIGKMPKPDRSMARRIHEIVKATALTTTEETKIIAHVKRAVS